MTAILFGMPRIAVAFSLFVLWIAPAMIAYADEGWAQGAEALGTKARSKWEDRFPFDGRPLTPGEIRFAATIFGNALNYPAIHVSVWKDCSLGCHPKDVGGDEIRMPKWAYEPDYSSASSNMLRCVFLHEITHLYQDERMGGFTSGVYGFLDNVIEDVYPYRYPGKDKYNYELDSSKHFLDYGMEQQAAIIEDYCLLGHGMEPVRLKGTIPPTTDLLPFYQKYLLPLISDPEHFVEQYYERRRRLTPGPVAWPHG